MVPDAALDFGLLLPLSLSAIGPSGLTLPCLIIAGILRLVFKNSYITLDAQGFAYHSGMHSLAHAWVDVERFAVVEHRMLGFIVISKYVG